MLAVFDIAWSGLGTASGQMQIAGLPFNLGTGQKGVHSGELAVVKGVTFPTSCTMLGVEGVAGFPTQISVWGFGSGLSSAVGVTIANLASTGELIGSLLYSI